MSNSSIPSISAYLENTLAGIAQAFPAIASQQQARLAVAYSGGLDSSVLLHAAAQYAGAHGAQLFAFHIHHGISPNADQWQSHCAEACARLGVVFDTRRIALRNSDKSGVEEAARISRYAALGDLCRQHQIPLLLTGHHLDDQAETVLLQLLRGSGAAGLSGMDRWNTAPTLLGDAVLLMARPLLKVSRAALEQYAAAQQLTFIEDESNHDPRYARNALRQQVMPVLAQHFPGFQERFSRSAGHMQTTQRLLIDLAAQDMAVCADGACLDLEHVRQLSGERIDNLLRYWFGLHHLRMPSSAWLSEMRQQLLEAKADAQLCVTHPDCHIRRHRNRVFLTPRDDVDRSEIEPQAFRWNGEAEMRFPQFGGVLHFDQAEQGIDADWLRAQSLQIQYRSGGERLKLALNRPTKSVKYHYQAFDVPPWERERLPLVSSGKQILFAAGIGMDCLQLAAGPGLHISLRWQADELPFRQGI
ncbi:tRNA lysidine(34) synthetase TilS [Collimonas fungivorans]|uniref:tRNA(Ile)-lysidine synthase n=1 Tax=Collimonas fungivorans (strain Ter331) TaxID=1005048 RepID=G0A958_COLFT|nr:tRNA(Ile)-lysidine synthetase [Collimonas fungivorans Ter331]